MEGKWIWLSDGKNTENERGIFAKLFAAQDLKREYRLKICACTKYIAYLNGEEIGKGPIRNDGKTLWYDTYPLNSLLRAGGNYLAVRVWNYGWSTYQSITADGGVFYEVLSDETVIAASDGNTGCIRDTGHKYNTVKRNVNLGFSDYFDARAFDMDILRDSRYLEGMKGARVLEGQELKLSERPIHGYHDSRQYPKRIISMQEMKNGCQQVSVNTRCVFFPERKDADETIFSGFLGCVIEAPEDMEGIIAFPNRTWNGLMGDFRIDGRIYHVTNQKREIRVGLKKGRQLFLIQLSGKYDDLYCHMEFCFPGKVCFRGLGKEGKGTFFIIGPTEVVKQKLDGISRVYGGLDEYDRLEEHTQLHEKIFACESEEEVSFYPVGYVPEEYIFYDEYIYSLVKREEAVKEIPISHKHRGILWNNLECTQIDVPAAGDCQRLIVDFGELYIGTLEFTVFAQAGTVLDIYCFENMFRGEVDYTTGLNNAVRYVCKEGWQTYSCMARMGCRYAMITVREQKGPVRIQKFGIHFSTYAPSNCGSFSCDDYLLNKIWEISRQTHLLCMEDSFTDCPTWEQAFWIGDAQISARVNAYLYGEYDFIRHNLVLAAGAVKNTPLMNALTPTDWNTSIPMWAMNYIVSIRQYIETSGDKDIVAGLYDTVKTTLMYYGTLIQEDGAFLINAWNMLDWADMDIHNHGVVTGQQALLAYCYGIAAEFADDLDYSEDKDRYLGYRKRLRRYIDEVLWDDERKMFVDGYSPQFGMSKTVSIQTHILLTLFQGIKDEHKEHLVKEYLKEPPEEFVQIGSPFMLFYLYEIWMMDGRTQEVLNDMKERFGKMLYYDSTTCWEVFPGFYENSRTRSYCHGWSASPVYFLSRYVLGVHPAEDGFRAVRIVLPDTDLNWCRGSIPTPYGEINVDMERTEGLWEYRIKLPAAIRILNENETGGRLTVNRY